MKMLKLGYNQRIAAIASLLLVAAAVASMWLFVAVLGFTLIVEKVYLAP